MKKTKQRQRAATDPAAEDEATKKTWDEVAAEDAKNWHLRATDNWDELVTGPRSPLWKVVMALPGTVYKTTAKGTWRKITAGGTVKERAAKLAVIYDEQQHSDKWSVKQHVLRKLTLDLVCASFPKNHPPPCAVVELLRRALDLPNGHAIGTWPLTAGLRDDRGGGDHEARTEAMLLDCEYRLKHGKEMSARKLAEMVTRELGRRCDHSSILRWRKEPDYWADYDAEPPAGYEPSKKE